MGVEDSPDFPAIEVAQYPFHRIGFALGLFALDRSGTGARVTLGLKQEPSGFAISANVQTETELPVTTSTLVQDRALLEHLVAQEGGVLSIAETKANGVIRITACFDPNNPRGLPDDDGEDASADSDAETEANSNILQLPPTGTHQ
jgi:hypothetical protein